MTMWYCALLLVTVVSTAPTEDLITYLPGLKQQPAFKHYAGYLNASNTKHFFYWFVESESYPRTDPVVLWLNGGPGCSSMGGFLSEQGPWRPTVDGKNLTWFEHRWNKISNMIFMESPHCVGFSYSDDGLCDSSDNMTALDNHNALRHFFQKFPEYAGNDFYLTGESYAGVYVPTLAARLVDDNKFNFKGFAVGNSITDGDMMANGFVYFAWARGLFGTDLWNSLLDECCVARNASNCVFYPSTNPKCQQLYDKADEQSRMGLNPYNIYAECLTDAPDARGVFSETSQEAFVMPPEGLQMMPHRYHQYKQFIHELSLKKKVTMAIPCVNSHNIEIYLNRSDVRHALHVPKSVRQWTPCSDSLNYTTQYGDVRAEYHKVHNSGRRIVAYYGDFDSMCAHLSGMWFVESLKKQLLTPFKEWNYPDSHGRSQVAGFVIQYDRLNFVSVKGAGHFVPTDKPLPAFIMYEKFLKNEPY